MDLITVRPEASGTIAVRLRKHEMRMEKSTTEGGEDRVFSPVEMMVASLGACIGWMVAEYCHRHGYADGKVTVYLDFRMGGSPKRIEEITVDLEIPRDVPEEMRKAIRRIAELCPVHQSFRHSPRIELELV